MWLTYLPCLTTLQNKCVKVLNEYALGQGWFRIETRQEKLMQEHATSQSNNYLPRYQTHLRHSDRTSRNLIRYIKGLCKFCKRANASLFHCLKGTALTLYEKERRLRSRRQQ